MPRREGVECSRCQDIMLGKGVSEAIADAKVIGWEFRHGEWICDSCIIEEERL